MTALANPTDSGLPLRAADFHTLSAALDYAGDGDTGYTFYNGRGDIAAVLPYRELRNQARDLALKLHGLELPRGSRVALVADTHVDFTLLFFACQYAALVPVPLPAAVHLGGRAAYVRHLRHMLQDCQAQAAFATDSFAGFLEEAVEGLDLRVRGTLADCLALPAATALPEPPRAEELAYLQYTSGSTRFPRGAMITQRAVMNNLAGIFRDGIRLTPADRFFSWLPFYHDMGLVGLVLGGVASQRTVDFMPTRDFAMRPRMWLTLMSRNRSTVSFSPPFGYALCARRLRPRDAEQLDLSSWRVAGIGAEMIRPSWLRRFAEALAPAGFDPRMFQPCYGMAECALGVSFSPLHRGLQVDRIDSEMLALQGEARAQSENTLRSNDFVNCGYPLPDYEIEVRDARGRPLPDRQCGRIFLRGPSLMSGYFNNPEATREALTNDGWLNTGDIGYRIDGALYITGRAKDLLIINGRNIWPHDLEHLAEQQSEVRPEDTSAFSVPGEDGSEVAVLVVQCREADPRRQADLVDRIQQGIRAEFGIACLIELVPPHTLPRTSSGKLSRSSARKEFLERHDHEVFATAQPYLVSFGNAERRPAQAAAAGTAH